MISSIKPTQKVIRKKKIEWTKFTILSAKLNLNSLFTTEMICG